MNKKDILILSIILVIATAFRIYKINTPLADFKSTHQANIASVARNFTYNGFNLLEPKYDDISSVPSGIENPEGYRFTEFPLYSATFAVLFKYLPITSLEVYGRLTTVFFSLILISILYYFGLKEHSRTAGIFAALLYAILPIFVFFSRVILPYTMGLALMFISIWFLYLYLKSKKNHLLYFICSIFFYGIALLVASNTFFYTIVIAYLFVATYKFDVFKKWQVYIFIIFGLIPFIAWRLYIVQFPEGIPDTTGLITSIRTSEGLVNIFFQPEYFKTMFMDRLGITILGIYMSCFLLLGLIGQFKKNFHLSMAASAFIFIILFQGANFGNEYQQTIILPAIALVCAIGIAQLIKHSNTYNKLLLYPSILIVIMFSFFFSYIQIKPYYEYPNDLTQIAKLVTTFTKQEDRIITDTNGDTTLLYLADRKGAPSIYKEIPELQEMGYSFLVTDKKELTDELRDSGLEVLVDNQKFSIIKL
jgi:MFS family permease